MKVCYLFLCSVIIGSFVINRVGASRITSYGPGAPLDAEGSQAQGGDVSTIFVPAQSEKSHGNQQEDLVRQNPTNQTVQAHTYLHRKSHMLLRHQTPKNKKRTNRKHKKHRESKERSSATLDEASARKRVRDSSWYYCSNGGLPRDVSKVMREGGRRGLMCQREYPTHTCCADEDLTSELVGSQVSCFDYKDSVATFALALRWMCDSPRTGCARRTTPIYMWQEQAIKEWSR